MVKKTYFISSDIHSFYDEYLLSLLNLGFDKDNDNHIIIICGDLFDRGPQSQELFDFIKSIPDNRKILIRGNHEDLMEEIFEKGYISSYDVSNGTVKTIASLCDCTEGFVFENLELCYLRLQEKGIFDLFDSMKNYVEIGDYIFVHGWIPTNQELSDTFQIVHKFNKKWREASEMEWSEARWTNGMLAYFEKCGEVNKTIVCGHWHSSYGHVYKKYKGYSPKEQYRLQFAEDACFDPFYDTKYKKSIIALDACTAHTHKVNVIKLEI